MSICKHLLILCLAACIASASEHHGQVLFAGLPVPGATVVATQGDKRQVAITDERGVYSFRDLADGVWAMQVEMLCFEPHKLDVTVGPGAPAALWELKMLPLATIQASAPPPAPKPKPAAPLTTSIAAPAPDTPSIQQPAAPVSTGKPAKGKGKGKAATQAQAQTPGQNGFQRADVNASSDAGKLTDETPADASKAADGFLVNGSVNNGAASPFAQSAAFGNNRRNGRSLYTEAIGLNLGNAALDASPFSLTGQSTPKPGYNYIQGTASFGGPLRIPHVIVGTSLNFFIGYQFTRSRVATTQPGLMPTLTERGGDLSQQHAGPIIDPANGLPFPDNVIPASRISPQASGLLRLFPQPNFDTAGRYNYQVPIKTATDTDGLNSRLSKTINNKNQISGLFAYGRNTVSNPNLFGFRDNTDSAGLNSSATWSHRVTNRMFSTFKVDYSRSSSRALPYFANRENIAGEAGITGNNQEPINWGPPALSFASGFSGLYDGQASFTRNQTAGIGADTFWNRRGHNLRFGVDFKRQQLNFLSQQDPRGSFGFTGAATQVTANGVPILGTGSDFADFLLGVPDTSSIAFGNADKYFRANIWDSYVTDDWRISPALTVNAGMRWEYGSPITEKYGRLVNLDIAPGFVAQAPVVAATPTGSLTGQQYPGTLLHPDRHGFEPRIGLAWRPFLASSTVVRAGYGVTYNTSVYTTIASQMAQQSPLSKSLSVANSAADPLTLANGFKTSQGITPNTFAVDPNFRVGYVQTWNVSIQRDLPWALIVTGGYLGIKGTRAPQEFLPNTFPNGAVNPCPGCPSGYVYLTSNGNSTRESGQLQLRRRLRSGFTSTLQYTFSKSIDDAALGGKGQGRAVIAQDWLNLSGERGLSTFDQRHLLNLQLQYTPGVGLGGGGLWSGWRGTLFKEWTFATQITAGSGLPLNPIYVTAVKGTGVTGSIRPQYTGAPLYAPPSGLFLNPAAYIAPLTGQWGNAGRNSITGPGQFSLDASVGRTFPFRDHGSIDLRFDATNALNHVTFPSWNTNITSTQFGLPGTANAMRTVRANLRVRF